MVYKATRGQVFLRVLLFSPVSIILPRSWTHASIYTFLLEGQRKVAWDYSIIIIIIIQLLSINVPRQMQNGQLQTANNNNDFHNSRHHDFCSDMLRLCTSAAAHLYRVYQNSAPVITYGNHASGQRANSSNGKRNTKEISKCNFPCGAAANAGHGLFILDDSRYDTILIYCNWVFTWW
jgi:hypothetical protein